MILERLIIADNQPLTAYAIEALSRSVAQEIHIDDLEIAYAQNKTQLNNLLRDGKKTAVVVDYTMFDFTNQENFTIVCDLYQNTSCWLLLSEELTPNFLRYVVYQTQNVGVAYKDASLDSMREALHYVMTGVRYISQQATQILLQKAAEAENRRDELTHTEREILKAIALGKTTKEIAADRFSSVHTINSHRKNIFRKLGVNCVHDAIKYALRAGLVDESEFFI